jgi:hypothetical protein
MGISFLEQDTQSFLSEQIAANNATEWLGTGAPISHMSHGPRPVDAWSFHQFKTKFQEAFVLSNEEIFRQHEIPSLLSDMYGRWLFQTGLGFKSKAKIGYAETSEGLEKDWALWTEPLSAFCINDTCDENDEAPELQKISQILEGLFPQKSRYEK